MGEQVDKHLNFSTCPLNGRMPFRSAKAPTAQSIRKITAKKWHAQEKQLKYLDARTIILNDELNKISDERNKIYDEKYKYSDIAVTEHQYWANDDFTMIVRIGDLNRTGPGIEFFVSTKGKKDEKYYSSSIVEEQCSCRTTPM